MSGITRPGGVAVRDRSSGERQDPERARSGDAAHRGAARAAVYSTIAIACSDTRRKPSDFGSPKMRGSWPGISSPPRRTRRIFL